MASSHDMRSNMLPLNENNYATWKVQCKMALMREGLWPIVNKEEFIPEIDDARRRESEEARRKFKIRYEKALTTIVLSVSPSLLYLLGEPEDPVKVWETLENQFQKKSWANKLILKTKLSLIDQFCLSCLSTHTFLYENSVFFVSAYIYTYIYEPHVFLIYS